MKADTGVSHRDMLRIQLESGVASETLRSYLRGGNVREASRRRIEAAAKVLKIHLIVATILAVLCGTSAPAAAGWGMCMNAMPSCANPSCVCTGTGSFQCRWECVKR